jgi:ketosteroid isomerase-like protein
MVPGWVVHRMDGHELLERLRVAVNGHDLEAVVACFTDDYVNETPAHPARGFAGRDQVRTNWERIFAGVPDVAATIVRAAVDGEVVWSEWELTGTRVDGVPQTLRGVNVFGVRGDQFGWARFYLEPVDIGDDGVDAAVGRIAEAQGR